LRRLLERCSRQTLGAPAHCLESVPSPFLEPFARFRRSRHCKRASQDLRSLKARRRAFTIGSSSGVFTGGLRTVLSNEARCEADAVDKAVLARSAARRENLRAKTEKAPKVSPPMQVKSLGESDANRCCKHAAVDATATANRMSTSASFDPADFLSHSTVGNDTSKALSSGKATKAHVRMTSGRNIRNMSLPSVAELSLFSALDTDSEDGLQKPFGLCESRG